MSMYFVGIDISKYKHDCCIISAADQQIVSKFTITNDKDGFEHLLISLKDVYKRQASISSMKIIHGAFFLASSNKSLTREAPTPTNISTKSEPEIEKNGTPASPATAFASNVFPVPGGPTSNTPFGIRAPT